MDFTIFLIFIILSAITTLIVFFIFRKSPTPILDEAASDYAEGLNLLLSGQREDALKKLKEAVTKNSRNVDAYLKIGDILRDSGRVEKAINVHKYLTVRKGLKPKQHNDILHGLAKDYLAARQYDKAFEVLNKILEENKTIVWAQEMKLNLYEQKEEWHNAFQIYKEINKSKSDVKYGRLALYKVQEGLNYFKNGSDKEAKNCFKEAIKIDPKSPPAYIYLADAYTKESRKNDALRILKEFVAKVPSQSYLVFERIKDLLYEGGVYGEIENLYLEIIGTQPENIMAHLALAENYEKKGEFEKAIATCTDVLEKEPSNDFAKKYLVRLYHKSGDNEKAVNQALELIDESLKRKELFKCGLCGYESEEAFWRCPDCFEWETSTKN